MKTLKYFILALYTTVAILSCTNDSYTPEPTFTLEAADNLSNDDYDIYSLIVASDSIIGSKNVVVRQQTPGYYGLADTTFYYQALKAQIPDIDKSAVFSFLQNNSDSYNLGNKMMAPGKNITLLSDQEWEFIFNAADKSWAYFYKKYPKSGGYFDFLRIGYNTDNDKAMVEFNQYSGGFAASGFIVFLKKENNEWKIVKVRLRWVS